MLARWRVTCNVNSLPVSRIVGSKEGLRQSLDAQMDQVGQQSGKVVLNDAPEHVVISDTYQVSLNVASKFGA